jgi:hypothetical protein
MFNPNPAFLLVAKVEISPQGLYGVKRLKKKKKNSICPQALINAELYGLVLAPRLKKGGQFATLGANDGASLE